MSAFKKLSAFKPRAGARPFDGASMTVPEPRERYFFVTSRQNEYSRWCEGYFCVSETQQCLVDLYHIDLIHGDATQDRACDSAVQQIFFDAPSELPIGPPRANGPSVVEMVHKSGRLDPFWPGSPRHPRGLYDKGIYPESPQYAAHSDSDSDSEFDTYPEPPPPLREVSVPPSRKRPRLVLPPDFDDYACAKRPVC